MQNSRIRPSLSDSAAQIFMPDSHGRSLGNDAIASANIHFTLLQPVAAAARRQWHFDV